VTRQEWKEKVFERGELPGRFMTRKLFRWSDKRYDQEYWERLERNWRRWKGKQTKGRKTIETIKEEKEIEQENLELREWTEEGGNKMDHMVDLYYEL